MPTPPFSAACGGRKCNWRTYHAEQASLWKARGAARTQQLDCCSSAISAPGWPSGSAGIFGGGNICPGGHNGIGRLPVKGTNTLVTGTIVCELAGSDRFDEFFTYNGPLTAGGILRVSLINGFVPAHKDVFKILDFPSVTGVFESLDLPLGASKWITDDLYITGEITFQDTRGTTLFIR